MNTLSVYQLPSLNKGSNVVKYLEKHELTRSFSAFFRQAQMCYGFISYMYQTKDKMNFKTNYSSTFTSTTLESSISAFRFFFAASTELALLAATERGLRTSVC